MPTEGVWTYAVVESEAAEPRLSGLVGVSGEPIRAVTSTGLTAVVGTVGLDQFGEDGLRRNLEDLDWLAAPARAPSANSETTSGSIRIGMQKRAVVSTPDFDCAGIDGEE